MKSQRLFLTTVAGLAVLSLTGCASDAASTATDGPGRTSTTDRDRPTATSPNGENSSADAPSGSAEQALSDFSYGLFEGDAAKACPAASPSLLSTLIVFGAAAYGLDDDATCEEYVAGAAAFAADADFLDPVTGVQITSQDSDSAEGTATYESGTQVDYTLGVRDGAWQVTGMSGFSGSVDTGPIELEPVEIG